MKVYGKEVPQEVIDAIEARMVANHTRFDLGYMAIRLGITEPISTVDRILSRRARKGHIVYDRSTSTWSRTDLWE